MKTVRLNTGELSIPIVIKSFITKTKMIKILADIVHSKSLDLHNMNKKEIMQEIRGHVKFQGVTVYTDWYEDTIETPIINDIITEVEAFVEDKFPELNE